METTVDKKTFQLEGAKGTLPVTIGIEGEDGMMMPLIKRGTRLPAVFNRVFTTTGSFQMSAYLHIVLGERPLVKDDLTLCIVRHDEGAFRSAGKSRYSLAIRVDGKGRVEVSSKNLDKKGAQQFRVSYEADIVSAETLRKLTADALAFREVDDTYQGKYDKLDSVRKQVNRLHNEVWPFAKKKMSLVEKHGYRQCRKNLQEIVRQGPSALDDGNEENLRALLEELDRWKSILDERARQVMAWYR